MKMTAQFRAVLAEPDPEPFIFPTVFDALSAQMVAQMGFKACCMGSSTTSNMLLGKPDCRYLTLTEMEFMVRRAVSAAPIPILADVDDGYGYALNVIETVRTLEAVGAVGIMIEDQNLPRTPLYGGVAVISKDEAVGKIKAAVDARRDSDFFIIGRTEAAWVEGLGSAIDRANRYAEAGADAIFLTGWLSADEMARVGREVNVAHRVAMFGDKEGRLSPRQMRELGFDMLPLGNQTARAAILGIYRYLDDIRSKRGEADHILNAQCKGTPMADWGAFTGFAEFRELERKYLPSEEFQRRYRKEQK